MDPHQGALLHENLKPRPRAADNTTCRHGGRLGQGGPEREPRIPMRRAQGRASPTRSRGPRDRTQPHPGTLLRENPPGVATPRSGVSARPTDRKVPRSRPFTGPRLRRDRPSPRASSPVRRGLRGRGAADRLCPSPLHPLAIEIRPGASIGMPSGLCIDAEMTLDKRRRRPMRLVGPLRSGCEPAGVQRMTRSVIPVGDGFSSVHADPGDPSANQAPQPPRLALCTIASNGIARNARLASRRGVVAPLCLPSPQADQQLLTVR